MKKIVIDGINLCAQHSGIHRYMIECLLEVDKLNLKNNNALYIEMVYPSRRTINCPEFKTIKIKKLVGITRYWYKYTLPFYIKIKNAVYVGMGNNTPAGKTNIVCLHDLIHIKPEAKRTQEVVDRHLELYEEIRLKCEYIVTVSECSKNDIVEHLQVPKERVLVIPCAWQHITKIGFDDSVFEKYDLLKRGGVLLYPRKYISPQKPQMDL